MELRRFGPELGSGHVQVMCSVSQAMASKMGAPSVGFLLRVCRWGRRDDHVADAFETVMCKPAKYCSLQPYHGVHCLLSGCTSLLRIAAAKRWSSKDPRKGRRFYITCTATKADRHENVRHECITGEFVEQPSRRKSLLLFFFPLLSLRFRDLTLWYMTSLHYIFFQVFSLGVYCFFFVSFNVMLYRTLTRFSCVLLLPTDSGSPSSFTPSHFLVSANCNNINGVRNFKL